MARRAWRATGWRRWWRWRHRVPQAELVIASANPQRLGETLAALGRLDAGRRAEIIACF
jgi:hypothetical protein